MLWWSVILLCASASAQDWQLVWSDEFDGQEIDPNKWEHEITAWGGGNGEFQVYVPDEDNSYIQDGKLFLRSTPLADNINPATGEPFGEEFLRSGVLDLNALYGRCDVSNDFGCYRDQGNIPPMASARLRTAGRFAFRYGRVEIRAQMPVGDWLWPAMWLLPEEWRYGGWPMSGEIDMTESIGNRDYLCNGEYKGIQHMGSTLHWGINWDQNKYFLTSQGVNKDDQNFGDYFHVYRVDWSPQGMEFFLDDELILTIPGGSLINDRDTSNCFTGMYDFGAPWNGPFNPWTNDLSCDQFMAPFDQEFHFVLNVAVGGTNYFIPDDCVNWGGDPNREKPWRNGVGQTQGMWDFYNARDRWEDTWTREGDKNAMQVDWVRVYQPAGGYERTQVPDGCPTPPGPNNCS